MIITHDMPHWRVEQSVNCLACSPWESNLKIGRLYYILYVVNLLLFANHFSLEDDAFCQYMRALPYSNRRRRKLTPLNQAMSSLENTQFN